MNDLSNLIKPKSLRQHLYFLGPGLLLAVAAAGESGITEAIGVGAHFGFSLIWVVLITILYKFAFANGIARYTLVTGETIFYGLRHIPGPKNWEVIFVMLIYFLEMIAFGGMLLLGGIFLSYLLPGIIDPVFIAIASLGVILLFLWAESYEFIERFVVCIVLVLFLGILYSISGFYFSVPGFLAGMIPSVSKESYLPIMAMMGAVGSGLNLLLYSVWLQEKTEGKHGVDYYKEKISSVNIDLVIAFVLVGVVTVAFIVLGMTGYAVSYLEHGDVLSLDALIGQILYVLGSIPYGIEVFLIIGYLIMFGATLTGMDGRARAISIIVRKNLGLKVQRHYIYHVILLLFVGILFLAFYINDPLFLIHHVTALASIVFALMGFMLVYLDLKHPEGARGSRLWVAVMGIGSFVFLFVALMMEEAVIEFGLPLIERLALVSIILYAFSRTELFGKILKGTAGFADKAWVVIIFGVLSIYGTMRGIEFMGVIVNFRDLAPIIAGLMGGPLMGAAVGLIGGGYRFSLGGVTGLSCAVATIVAGIVAGLFVKMYRGNITYFMGIILVFLVETLHIFVVMPLLTDMPSVAWFTDVIRVIYLPMVCANAFGLLVFLYIVKDTWRRFILEKASSAWFSDGERKERGKLMDYLNSVIKKRKKEGENP